MAAEPLVITDLSVRKKSVVVDVKQLERNVVEIMGKYQLCVRLSSSADWEFTFEEFVPDTDLSNFVTAQMARGGEINEKDNLYH